MVVVVVVVVFSVVHCLAPAPLKLRSHDAIQMFIIIIIIIIIIVSSTVQSVKALMV